MDTPSQLESSGVDSLPSISALRLIRPLRGSELEDEFVTSTLDITIVVLRQLYSYGLRVPKQEEMSINEAILEMVQGDIGWSRRKDIKAKEYIFDLCEIEHVPVRDLFRFLVRPELSALLAGHPDCRVISSFTAQLAGEVVQILPRSTADTGIRSDRAFIELDDNQDITSGLFDIFHSREPGLLASKQASFMCIEWNVRQSTFDFESLATVLLRAPSYQDGNVVIASDRFQITAIVKLCAPQRVRTYTDEGREARPARLAPKSSEEPWETDVQEWSVKDAGNYLLFYRRVGPASPEKPLESYLWLAKEWCKRRW